VRSTHSKAVGVPRHVRWMYQHRRGECAVGFECASDLCTVQRDGQRSARVVTTAELVVRVRGHALLGREVVTPSAGAAKANAEGPQGAEPESGAGRVPMGCGCTSQPTFGV